MDFANLIGFDGVKDGTPEELQPVVDKIIDRLEAFRTNLVSQLRNLDVGLWEVVNPASLVVPHDIDMQLKYIQNVKDPATSQDAATKKYVDNNSNNYTDDMAVAAIAAIGGVLVDRGDPAIVDFSVGDLTTDGNWHDLDLSAIVPVGTKAVHLRIQASDDVPDRSFHLRKKGSSNNLNSAQLRTQVANVSVHNDCVVSCDSNRVIEYKAANTVWTTLYVIVRGWYI